MQEKNMLCPAVFKSHHSVGAFHNFYQTDAGAFFYHPQRPEIYKVTANTSNIDKIISFGEHNLPPLEWIKDKSSDNKDFTGALFGSGYICNFYLTETNKYIITTYAIVSSKKNYLGFYNKETKSSCKYEMHDFFKRTGLFMGYNIYGIYNDYVITLIPVPMLKNQDIKNPILKSIIDNSTEEDNPILCFFKWK
jgi:hypothetical protein